MNASDWFEAVHSGDIDFLRRLTSDVSKLTSINSVDSDNRTALHWACALGKTEMVRVLIAAKADVSTCDDEGWTPVRPSVLRRRLFLLPILTSAVVLRS